jgi:hypothetical protein
MKYSNYLVKIQGVSIYPIISLSIFVIFFCLVIFLVMRMSKKEVNEVSILPLD